MMPLSLARAVWVLRRSLSSRPWPMAIFYPTNNHLSFSMVIIMFDLFTVGTVTDFSFKWVETDKPVDQVKLG